MKTRKLFLLLVCGALMLPFYQCEKKGDLSISGDDSDAPPWVGGDTDENTHTRGNDDSGTGRGGDYGDLYVLKRDLDGVPEMIQLEVEEDTFWVVQPIDIYGDIISYNDEGELSDVSAAIEVEFGRLNLVRSPESVINHAFLEALTTIRNADEVTLDFCGRLMMWKDGVVTSTIDSPLENLALYKYFVNNLFENYESADETLCLEKLLDFDPMMLATSCLAAGSDKTGTLTIDEVVYINGFMGCIGLNEIPNLNEYDSKGEVKKYVNFTDYDKLGTEFYYNREETYQNRYIQFLIDDEGIYYPLDENGVSASPKIVSINDYFENNGLFTEAWHEAKAHQVSGFTLAADDAVQVLDYIHGNSNIIFLPDYTE